MNSCADGYARVGKDEAALMTSYAYRATTKGTSKDQTIQLLMDYGFLWRSAFKDTEQRSHGDLPPLHGHLKEIDPDGDELFLYFSSDDGLQYIGAFSFTRVRRPAHPDGDVSAVVRVDPEEPLHAALERAGYAKDPFLQLFTGFDVVPLEDSVVPPGEPRFAGQYSIGTFGESQPHASALESREFVPAAAAPPLGATAIATGRCWGIDWSGAKLAGNKVWRAELDPTTKSILDVSRPWADKSASDVVDGVVAWLADLGDAWVALDFPFGMASDDQASLVGSASADPRERGQRVAERYATIGDFILTASQQRLIGRHRRATDQDTDQRAPFAPLLYQLIYQTYWGHRLLARLPEGGVAVLPWDHDAPHARVRVIEACPAMLLRAVGESNQRYKLKKGTEARRQALLEAVMTKTGWTCRPGIVEKAARDVEGDVLDAILCGLAAWRASAANHAAILSRPNRPEEGHIYT